MYRDFETLNVNAEVDIHPDINFWLHEAQGLDEHEKFIYFYHKDHLGSSAQISDIDANIVHHIEYMPFGETFFEKRSHWATRYKFNAKEKDEETGLYYYGARYYTPDLSIWLSVDPLSDKYPHQSTYTYCSNNPLNKIDYSGLSDDWVENASGKIYWDKNATSQTTTKKGETYLGKNVLVGTHNRDATGNEPINSATFDLYLESDKTGPLATIKGNTVSGDITKFGTLAEGLYPARFQGRASKLDQGIDDLSLFINEGKDVPTVNGNPNNANSDMLNKVFFHAGNYGKKRLTYLKKDGSTGYISKGCQTSGCGKGSRPLHNAFMEKVERDFNGFYYLRAKPK